MDCRHWGVYDWDPGVFLMVPQGQEMAVKASGTVATRNWKIDQGSYLPPSLHLRNLLAPCISAQLALFFFLCSFTTSPCIWQKIADPSFPKICIFSSLTTRGWERYSSDSWKRESDPAWDSVHLRSSQRGLRWGHLIRLDIPKVWAIGLGVVKRCLPLTADLPG